MRILLIDDDARVRAITALVLRRYGHHVIEAATGRAGLAEAARAPFDLVMTDINMPEMSGTEVIARLVECDFRGPVIAISGDGRRPEDQDAGLPGIAEVTRLPKPFGVHDLVSAVDQAMAAAGRTSMAG